MIDKETIRKIMDTANIVEVVSEFVTLKRAGVNYRGLCPFHDEKTPSFYVSPSRGICKCFSCGKGGNVVHFLMEHEQFTYPEALRWLARKYHIEIHEKEQTDEERLAESKRESMYILNDWAAKYFMEQLHHHSEGIAIGMPYFRMRGFRDDTIYQYGLGYCPKERTALASAAKAAGFNEEYLVSTGLCYKRDDGRLIDRFSGRVMFPVHTVGGRVVAFGGRVLVTDKNTAKYVNSPESEIYNKRNELYGIFLAKRAIQKEDRCFLVEGYTDVISMHQSGIENVVASSGTSLTPGQIRQIRRFTNNITVLYDGDRAGIKASIRGIDMLLAEGMNVKVLLLPDNDDPDSFARKHSPAEYREYISSHQTDFIKFKTELFMEDAGDDPVKRAALIENIVTSISLIPDKILCSMYIRQCSNMLKEDEALLSEAVRDKKRGQRIEKMRQQEREQNAETATPTGQTGTQTVASAEAGPAMTAATPASPEEISATRTIIDAMPTSKMKRCEDVLVKLVINYGNKVINVPTDENGVKSTMKVAGYIQACLNADGLVLSDPINAQILSEAANMSADDNFDSAKYFLYHQNLKISSKAAGMESDKYNVAQIEAQDEENSRDKMFAMTDNAINMFRLAYVEKEIDKVLARLSDPAITADEKQNTALMKQYHNLKSLEIILARKTGGSVVL